MLNPWNKFLLQAGPNLVSMDLGLETFNGGSIYMGALSLSFYETNGGCRFFVKRRAEIGVRGIMIGVPLYIELLLLSQAIAAR